MQTISIITPILNAEKYISETIESIIFQRGDFELEHIIVDGNSNDQTIAICTYYRDLIQELVDKKLIGRREIVIVSEPDEGLYDALSKGLLRASGEIVGYLNASDRYVPGALESVQRAFNAQPEIKWLTGWNSFSDEPGSIFLAKYPFQYSRKLIQRYYYGSNHNHIQQESTFWARELNLEIDHKKLKKMRYAGDFYLWYEFSKKHELWVVDALLGVFRKHGNQLSEDFNKYQNEALSIAQRRSRPFLTVLFCKVCGLMPNKIKRFLNRYSISFV